MNLGSAPGMSPQCSAELNHFDGHCKFGNIREDFIFAKLRICEVSWKQDPREMAKLLCHLLIKVNHITVAIL